MSKESEQALENLSKELYDSLIVHSKHLIYYIQGDNYVALPLEHRKLLNDQLNQMKELAHTIEKRMAFFPAPN